jgi:hypothetical protein
MVSLSLSQYQLNQSSQGDVKLESEKDVRCCGSVEQDIAVLKVLSFRAVLEVLLKGVAALRSAPGWRDGCGVDNGGVFGGVCHDESVVV